MAAVILWVWLNIKYIDIQTKAFTQTEIFSLANCCCSLVTLFFIPKNMFTLAVCTHVDLQIHTRKVGGTLFVHCWYQTTAMVNRIGAPLMLPFYSRGARAELRVNWTNSNQLFWHQKQNRVWKVRVNELRVQGQTRSLLNLLHETGPCCHRQVTQMFDQHAETAAIYSPVVVVDGLASLSAAASFLTACTAASSPAEGASPPSPPPQTDGEKKKQRL